MNSAELYYQKRHTFLINRELQLRFVVFVIAILIGYSLFLLIFQKLSKTLVFPLMIPMVFGGLIIFIGIISIFYSHRFAGPLFAILRALKEIAEGHLLTKVHIRKEHNVAFHEIAENINKITDNFHDAIIKIEERIAQLSNETQSLRERILSSHSKSELVFQIDRMQEMEGKIKDVIKGFKV